MAHISVFCKGFNSISTSSYFWFTFFILAALQGVHILTIFMWGLTALTWNIVNYYKKQNHIEIYPEVISCIIGYATDFTMFYWNVSKQCNSWWQNKSESCKKWLFGLLWDSYELSFNSIHGNAQSTFVQLDFSSVNE